MSTRYGLPVKDSDTVEDRLIVRAKDPGDHRDWHKMLPYSEPQFFYHRGGDTFLRWSMPRRWAEHFGLWGHGCQCCGAGAESTGDHMQFDTLAEQTDWFLPLKIDLKRS